MHQQLVSALPRAEEKHANRTIVSQHANRRSSLAASGEVNLFHGDISLSATVLFGQLILA